MFKSGPYTGKALTLFAGKTITMGRNRDVELPLPDLKLSRRHCQVFYDGQYVRLKDLGSTNGTFLNGARLSANIDTDLKAFDRIMMGAIEIEILDVEPIDKFKAISETDKLPGSAHIVVKSDAEPAPSIPALNFDDMPNVEIATTSAGSGFLIPNASSDVAPTQYADPFQAALAELSLPLPPEPPPLSYATAKSRINFCDNCNASIPQLDYDLGNAKEINGKLCCKHCLAQAATQHVQNISPSAIKAAAPALASPKVVNLNDELEEII
ncbi:MAG: FHA domain-containing protein [Planctomycetota bacterium]